MFMGRPFECGDPGAALDSRDPARPIRVFSPPGNSRTKDGGAGSPPDKALPGHRTRKYGEIIFWCSLRSLWLLPY